MSVGRTASRSSDRQRWSLFLIVAGLPTPGFARSVARTAAFNIVATFTDGLGRDHQSLFRRPGGCSYLYGCCEKPGSSFLSCPRSRGEAAGAHWNANSIEFRGCNQEPYRRRIGQPSK